MNAMQIAGRIGLPAEVRHTSDGKPAATFKVAVSEFKSGKQQTLWVKCWLWGDRGEKLAKYLTKGAPVAVKGRASVGAWIDRQSGEARAEIQLMVDDITLLGSRTQESADADQPAAVPGASAQTSADDFGDLPF